MEEGRRGIGEGGKLSSEIQVQCTRLAYISTRGVHHRQNNNRCFFSSGA